MSRIAILPYFSATPCFVLVTNDVGAGYSKITWSIKKILGKVSLVVILSSVDIQLIRLAVIYVLLVTSTVSH